MHLSQPLKNTLIPLLKINILFAKIIKSVFLIDIFLYPRERSSDGYFFVWHWLTIFGTWVYYHERICRKHSWSRYDLKLELWPQGQIYRDFDMALCSGLSFFVLWHCHTFFGTWVNHHGTMCHVHSWTLYDLDINIKIIYSPWIWVWQDFCTLWHRHETTCCLHSWP